MAHRPWVKFTRKARSPSRPLMLVVVASALDVDANKLVTRWKEHDAALMTCQDLSTPGWRHHLGHSYSSAPVIGGRVVPMDDVKGVFTRRPWIFPEELTHIVLPDREYVAAEMSAFLVSWLSELTCPVVNQPTPTCLSGPGWRQPQWAHLAARLDIQVSWDRWQIPPPASDDVGPPSTATVEVIIVDGRCFGAPDAATAVAAQRLASVARVRLAGFQFTVGASRPVFVSANLWPSVEDPAVNDAVLQSLLCPAEDAQ